ncbi:MAG: HAD hydrolase family protein [Dehalococcoidia bacterium]|nr:HAD hydrolase family protein [Dehalococcoidia bacterium]
MNLPDFSKQTPRAIALDLDETTLNSNARLNDRTRAVLHAVHKLAVPIIIATSRPERVLPALVGDDILKISSVVQMNGTVAIGKAGLAGKFNRNLDLNDARKCWNLIEEYAPWTRRTLEVDGNQFAVSHDDDIEELWAFDHSASPMVISFEQALKIGPTKISINGIKRDLEALAIRLEKRLSNKTIVLRAASKLFLNVIPSTASKSLAIANLLKSADIPLADVLSFGDDFVDIDLISKCGWSVAVDNAIPEIKKIAKYHTASNDNNGVAIVLERLVFALS